MRTSESIEALRRANPRRRSGFAQSVDSVAVVVQASIAGGPQPTMRRRPVRRRAVRVSAAGALVAVAAGTAAFLLVASPGGGPVVDDAAAAMARAATVTAASAERSGTAVVRITRGSEVWAGATVRWHDGDLAVSQDAPLRRGRAGSELRMVDGVLYGVEPEDGGWVVLGSPASIDPGSGTTPDEYLAAAREDVGGVTLRRITQGMAGLATRRLADGSTVYSGTVAAGLVARESGFKDGQGIRLLPFGYVAHDEAADPTARLDASVTVAGAGIVREIAVTWGSATAWTYTVTYRDLGAAEAIRAPASARPLRTAR
jgi:hypothetical protein